MSFLNKAEDWIIRKLMSPSDFDLHPSDHPPNDDIAIAWSLFTLLLLATAATCGTCLAR
jgi:hypothetical protein